MKLTTDFSNIKQWYVEEHSTDELGEELKDDITFNGLFRCLDSYKDVYEFLGVSDSLVRERVFNQLSIVIGVDYDYIYEQWLLGA